MLFFIQTNPNIELVREIQSLVKPSNESIAAFKSEVVKIAKTADEYNEYFKEDGDLVVFVRKNVELNPNSVTSFLDGLRDDGFNDSQVDYARELLTFISQNGSFKRQDLLREELSFGDKFNNIEIGKLLEKIDGMF